jgi:hypothetical protein
MTTRTKLSARRVLPVFACCFGVLLTSCSPSDSAATSAASGAKLPENTDPMYAALAEAEYPLELSPTNRVRLTHGLYAGSSAPGSAAKLSVRLGKHWAKGDLNADGKPDGAVLLVAHAGGSGTFSYLAVALHRGTSIHPVASVPLGDRIEVDSLSIQGTEQGGEVVVQLLTRNPGEPMTSAPSVAKSNRYMLQEGRLVAR